MKSYDSVTQLALGKSWDGMIVPVTMKSEGKVIVEIDWH